MTNQLSEIINDAELIRVHGNANFGTMTPREVVNDGVRKVAVGYHTGHTQFCILRDHGLITKPRGLSYDAALTKKGKKYARGLSIFAHPGRLPLESTGAKAVVRGGQIVISIDVDALPLIVSGSCATYGLSGTWKVSHAPAFATEVCHALNAEREDGTTRVHLMFDAAFAHAIDQGAEGIEPVTEAEFEAEAARLRKAVV